MFASLRFGALPVVLAAFVSILLAGCGSIATAPPRVLAQGAAWEEVSSRVGKFTSEGVVAARDGTIYVIDLTPAEVFKQNNPGGTIYRYDPATGVTTKYMEPSGMAFGLHVDRNGDLIIAQGSEPAGGRAIVRRNLATGATTVIADSYQGKRFVAPNDVTSDEQGRLYFTDARYWGHDPMDLPNAVYRIDPDGRVVQISTDVLRPNGIEVSPDSRRLYVAACNVAVLPRNPIGPAADRFGLTTAGVVAYDLDRDGNVSNGRVFYRDPELPCADGMAMDADGNLYVTVHNGRQTPIKGQIVVLDPDGKVLETIAPVEGMRPASIGFGRGSDANSLYMTTLFQWRLYRIKTVRRGHDF
jgi:gluconolactonase